MGRAISARAASAGTYILFASHIATMAPGTNLGAATPVSLGGGKPKSNPFSSEKEDKPQPSSESPPSPKDKAPSDIAEEAAKAVPASNKTSMEKKVINDAAAYIQSLAKLHGRNAQWAEKAVRQAASLDAEQALKQNVIDFIANDINQVVKQSNNTMVKLNGVETPVELNNVTYVEREQDWRFKLLSVLTNPNVAYILMLLGMYGLLLEFYSPGVGLAGVLGGICLVLAMYSLQMLPISYAGLALLVLGIMLMVAEAFSPSFGVLGLRWHCCFCRWVDHANGYRFAWLSNSCSFNCRVYDCIRCFLFRYCDVTSQITPTACYDRGSNIDWYPS